MATTIYARNTKTYPRAIPSTAYYDLLAVNGVSLQSVSTSSTTPASPEERPFLMVTTPMSFWSQRVAAQVTIAGSITFVVRASCTSGHTGRLRARLFKITAGGSAIETLIVQADASSDLVDTATTTYTFSATPPVGVVVTPGERFIWRMSVVPAAGGFGAGNATMTFGSISPSLSSVAFTETVTFLANGVIFLCRDTTTIGIGTFRDLSETRKSGAPLLTGVVNTTAGGTEIQWTKTAGGAVMEWISPRFAAPGWTVEAIGLFGSLPVGVHESNAAANCTVRVKVFRRKPDGTELLVATWTFTTAEMQVTIFKSTMTAAMGTLAQVTNFAEDDRIVVRYYIVPFTALTMGGGHTCTLSYDYNVAGSAGDNQVVILDSPGFKAEGDPSGVSVVTGGMMMGGVGN